MDMGLGTDNYSQFLTGMDACMWQFPADLCRK